MHSLVEKQNKLGYLSNVGEYQITVEPKCNNDDDNVGGSVSVEIQTDPEDIESDHLSAHLQIYKQEYR